MANKITLSKEELKGLSKTESINLVKNLLKTKSKRLRSEDFLPGKILMYNYNAKDKSQTYDRTPLVMILKTSKRHVLGINFHWSPIPLRVVLVKKILYSPVNRRNIKLGKPLEFSYLDLKPFLKKIGFAPIIRLYIKNRISDGGVVIPDTELMNIARTKSESFTQGKVSAEQLYKLALKRNKQYRSTRKRRE